MLRLILRLLHEEFISGQITAKDYQSAVTKVAREYRKSKFIDNIYGSR